MPWSLHPLFSKHAPVAPHPPPPPQDSMAGPLSLAYGATMTKQGGLGMRQWLRIDEYGETSVLEADKYAIMRRCSIPARDLRILDPSLAYPSTILGRGRAIVVNLEYIKAIVTAEEVLVQNWKDPAVAAVVKELQRRITTGSRLSLTDLAGTSMSVGSPDASRSQSPPHAQPTHTGASAHERPRSWSPPRNNARPRSKSPIRGREHSVRAGQPRRDGSVSRQRNPMGDSTERSWSPAVSGGVLREHRGRSFSPLPHRGRPHLAPPEFRGRSPVRHRTMLARSRSPPPPHPKPSPLKPTPRDTLAAAVHRSDLPAHLQPLLRPEPGGWQQEGKQKPPRTRSWSPFTGLFRFWGGGAKGVEDSTPALAAEGEGVEGGREGGGLPVPLPLEFKALEVILEAVAGWLEAMSSALAGAAYPVLDRLTAKIDRGALERERRLKSSVLALTVRVQKVRDEIEGLLNDDDDMRQMHLTRKLLHDHDLPASPASSAHGGAFGSTLPSSPPRLSDLDSPASTAGRTHPPPPHVPRALASIAEGGVSSPHAQRLGLELDLESPHLAQPPFLGAHVIGVGRGGTVVALPGEELPPVAEAGGDFEGALEAPTPTFGPVGGGAFQEDSFRFHAHGGEDEQFSGFSSALLLEGAGALPPDWLTEGVPELAPGGAPAPGSLIRELSLRPLHLATPEPPTTSAHLNTPGHPYPPQVAGVAGGVGRLRRSRSLSSQSSGRRSRSSRSSSSKHTHKSQEGVEELEMLLEAYFVRLEGTLNTLSALREYIDDTEDYVNIRLDDHQNKLLKLEIVITVATVLITLALVVVGVLGMNIHCFLFGDGGYFPWAMVGLFLGSGVVGVLLYAYIRWKRLMGN